MCQSENLSGKSGHFPPDCFAMTGYKIVSSNQITKCYVISHTNSSEIHVSAYEFRVTLFQ